jgi:diadenosine tetraphosphate (Ap4A) HIT family hydrolase
MIQEIQELVVKNIYKYFANNDVNFFLGGSRRFHYENDDSDYDFFVSDDPDMDIHTELIALGFKLNKNESYPGTVYEFRINDKNLVHIIMLYSSEYSKIKELHDNIRKNMSKDISKICLYLKKIEKFSGTRIFNILKILK